MLLPAQSVRQPVSRDELIRQLDQETTVVLDAVPENLTLDQVVEEPGTRAETEVPEKPKHGDDAHEEIWNLRDDPESIHERIYERVAQAAAEKA